MLQPYSNWFHTRHLRKRRACMITSTGVLKVPAQLDQRYLVRLLCFPEHTMGCPQIQSTTLSVVDNISAKLLTARAGSAGTWRSHRIAIFFYCDICLNMTTPIELLLITSVRWKKILCFGRAKQSQLFRAKSFDLFAELFPIKPEPNITAKVIKIAVINGLR